MPSKYAPFYCEENVWHLCVEPRFDVLLSRVVIISNPSRTCALWAQRAARLFGEPVTWDYHVILVARTATEWEVWDLDATLGFPVSLSRYLVGTFPPALRDQADRECLSPRFRVLEASTYRREFSSDRAHMHGPDGSWCQPPPPWPAVVREGVPSFIRWTAMIDSDPEVVSLDDLLKCFPPDG